MMSRRKIIVTLLVVLISLIGIVGFNDSKVSAKSKTVLYNARKRPDAETYYNYDKEYRNSEGFYTKCQIKGNKLIIKGSLNSYNIKPGDKRSFFPDDEKIFLKNKKRTFKLSKKIKYKSNVQGYGLWSEKYRVKNKKQAKKACKTCSRVEFKVKNNKVIWIDFSFSKTK